MKLVLQSATPMPSTVLDQLAILCQTAPDWQANNTAAFELGSAADAKLRATVRKIVNEHQIDHGWMKEIRPLTSFGLLVFDMDSTLINIECIDELAECVGRKAEVQALTDRAMQGEEMDYDQSLIARVSMLKGLPVSELERVYKERLKITHGARELISAASKSGLKTAIISGGFDYFSNRLKAELNLDFAIANTLDVSNEVLTGTISNAPVNAQKKAQTVMQHCKTLGISPSAAIVIGDGANDLQMMGIAGLAAGFRPKDIVAASVDVLIEHLDLSSLLHYMQMK